MASEIVDLSIKNGDLNHSFFANVYQRVRPGTLLVDDESHFLVMT